MVPDINLGSALGCAHRWNDARACFEPVVDAWGGSTLPGVFFAGDAAGAAGAAAAEPRGQLAALAVANALGRIDAKARDAAAVKPRASLTRALRGRAFLDALHRPADAYRLPRGATVVCRANVTAEQVIDALRGVLPGRIRSRRSRAAGWSLPGRFCGLTLTGSRSRARSLCGPGGLFPVALAGEAHRARRARGVAEFIRRRARGRARRQQCKIDDARAISAISLRISPFSRDFLMALWIRSLLSVNASKRDPSRAGGWCSPSSRTGGSNEAQGKDDLWEMTTKMEMPGMPRRCRRRPNRLLRRQGQPRTRTTSRSAKAARVLESRSASPTRSLSRWPVPGRIR